MTAERIVYVGALDRHGTCHQRMRALQDLGHEVVPVPFAPDLSRTRALAARAGHHLFRLGVPLRYVSDPGGINGRVLAAVRAARPDILWLDKALAVEAGTLAESRRAVPGLRIVGYAPDDMGGRHNQSVQFLAHLPAYDVFFTTKSYNVAELRALGCRHPVLVGNAYDPHTHRPHEVSPTVREALGSPVGFVGQYERARGRSLRTLARCGVPVRVWGPTWHRLWPRADGLRLEHRSVLGDDYAAAISATDVNLAFLRRLNRDRQTTRSVEIPACGGFMLAERTDEHLALFEESREAAFFGSDEELVDKVRFYLRHEDARRRIAVAGRRRCLTAGYSNHERLRGMLEVVRACEPA